MVPQFYEISNAERSEEELTALRQVTAWHAGCLRESASLVGNCVVAFDKPGQSQAQQSLPAKHPRGGASLA